MKTFRFLGFALVAILLCLSACSKGGDDDPISPTPKPEVNNPTITLDSSIQASGLSFDTSASEKSISFTTTSDWTLSIAETRSGTEWCTASPTSGGKGTANVKFTTTENTDPDDRSVAVTIKAGATSKTFTITQKSNKSLLITTKKYELPKEGGEIEIEVKANVEYQMTIAESAKEWITEATGRALTTHKHILKIAPSEEAVKREGEITFKSGDMVETVKIYQAGEAVLLLSKNKFTVSDAGETISVDLKSNVEYGVQMPNVDWIQVEEASRAMSSHTLKYIVSANVTDNDREARIIFYDKNSSLKETLKIIQSKKQEIPYLTFTAENEQTFTMSSYVETLEYSVNGGEWTKLGGVAISFGGDKGNLRLRGQNFEGTANDQGNFSIIRFKNDSPVNCFGDIRTLIDYKNYSTVDTSIARFNRLFYNCKNLISSPQLPATTLALGCYKEMFYGCTSLTNAPELPATTLAQSCYSSMFAYCTSLTNAPEKLPAITLKDYCYNGMFAGCTSLTNAPELPATTLKNYCYWQMFYGCTSLINAPELPATTLAYKCYFEMFAYCTNLINGPKKLPATTLTIDCYWQMFYGCTSLTNAPELPATTLEEYCYYKMFEGCTSLTNAPELPATTLAYSCYSSMFAYCTSLTNAPELPATTLAQSCYSSMFAYCTSLTKVPEKLPATTLTYSCYSGMFYWCSSLTNAPELPATTLAQNCYSSMFEGCTSLTNGPKKLPATTLAKSCYSKMFYECTNLTNAPELPARSLEEGCYSEMFKRCYILNNITMLATSIPYEDCLYHWVIDVSSTGIFIKSPNMTSLPNGYNGIPSGWQIENYTEE